MLSFIILSPLTATLPPSSTPTPQTNNVTTPRTHHFPKTLSKALLATLATLLLQTTPPTPAHPPTQPPATIQLNLHNPPLHPPPPPLPTPSLHRPPQNTPHSTILLRMLVALSCGAIIGTERRIAAANAGIRTLSLVSLGSAIFSLTALHGLSGDPARMAAAVSTGIGFLGSGAIDNQIPGSPPQLVTAASIWIAAALGVAAASGMYRIALFGAVLTVWVLRWHLFRAVFRVVFRRWRRYLRRVLQRGDPGVVDANGKGEH